MGNTLASKVDLRPQGNPDLLAEMATLMQEQTARIQELERNKCEMPKKGDVMTGIANIVGTKDTMSPASQGTQSQHRTSISG